jgi:porphobilinogen synthase
MVKETLISPADLVMPLFVCPGRGVKNAIKSMPGNHQLSVDMLVKTCDELYSKGVRSVLLFGIPENRDEHGLVATDDDAIVQRAIKAIKDKIPDLYIIADICNCEYTTHGHCGTIIDGDVHNDKTLQTLSSQALSFARVGADMIAPSDMMDGRVAHMRDSLDKEGYYNMPIMSYSAKYASAFYGSFRDAAQSSPKFGNRATYQMDPPNSDEAMREIELDLEEGADIVMIKPALSYLDVIRRAKDTYNIPVAAYNVSGEFSMVKAAAEKGWIDEECIVKELLTSIKRAGADIILSYHTREIVDKL